MIDNQQVGVNIGILRQQKGLSQQGLADICNVTHQAVSKWEKGAALPDMQTMLFLSKFFQVPMERILMEEIIPEPEAATEPAEENAGAPALDADFQETEPESAQGEPVAGMDWAQIVSLAPFASTDVIDRLIQEKLEQGDIISDWGMAYALLPFASRKAAERLFLRFQSQMDRGHIAGIAPFVSKEFLEKAVEQADGAIEPEILSQLAPFLRKETVNKLLLNSRRGPQLKTAQKEDKGGESVRLRIARKAAEEGNEEWLSENLDCLQPGEQAEICRLLLEKGQWEPICEAMENLPRELQASVFQGAVEKGAWDFILEAVENNDFEEAVLRPVLDAALAQSKWEVINAVSHQLM